MAPLHPDNAFDDFQDIAGSLVDGFMALDDLRQATDFAKRLAEPKDEVFRPRETVLGPYPEDQGAESYHVLAQIRMHICFRLLARHDPKGFPTKIRPGTYVGGSKIYGFSTFSNAWVMGYGPCMGYA